MKLRDKSGLYDTLKMYELAVANKDCTEGLDYLQSLPAKATKEQLLNNKYALNWAVRFASNVIKGRWSEAEEVIKTDSSATNG